MKTLSKCLILGLFALTAFSCNSIQAQFERGNGNITDSERKVSGFNYIEIEDGIDLYITQGSETKLVVQADQNLHEYIKTEVNGDVLRIYLSKNIYKANRMAVELQVPDLKGVSASGGSDIDFKTIFKVADFSAICSGGSDINLKVETGELKFRASGGSDGFVSGKASIFKADASGGSDIKAFSLESGDCYVEVTGGSDAEVNTNGKLLARGSGGSDVSYKGSPTNIDSNMSGGSDLIRD